MRSSPTNVLAFSSILTGVALAQGTEILGCADVDCPTHGDTATNDCNVANSTFVHVGVAPIPAPATTDDNGGGGGALAGLEWVQGMDERGASDGADGANRRVFETSFLLATPPSFYDNENGTLRACAVLFHGLDGIGADTDSTCSGIEGACLDALRERARNLRFGDGDDPCESLEEDLRDNFDSECREIVGDANGGWPELTLRTIAGPGSIQPFSQQANSSSNCWPVTSKDSNLTFIEFRSQTTEDYGPEPILRWMGEVTPILTVAYGGSSSSSSSSSSDGGDTSAQMTCIRAVDSSTVSEENKDRGGEETPPSGATSARLPSMGSALGAVVAVGALVSVFA